MIIICKGCSKEFKVKNRTSKRYCNRECFNEKQKLKQFLTEKSCTNCKEIKLRKDFYIDDTVISRMSSECKKCLRKRAKPKTEERREKVRLKSKEYYYKDNNKEKSKQRLQQEHFKCRALVLNYYGNGKIVCNCCKLDIQEFLTIDHINNNGADHRKSLHSKNKNSHGSFYRWLVKENFPAGFQLLCWNCNFGKYRYGTCPHITNKGNSDE